MPVVALLIPSKTCMHEIKTFCTLAPKTPVKNKHKVKKNSNRNANDHRLPSNRAKFRR